MKKSFYGSINLQKVLELIQSRSTAIFSKNGDPRSGMLNVSIFINDEADKYGNVGTITVKNKDTGSVVYVGNFKESTFSSNKGSSNPENAKKGEDLLNDFLNS